MNTDSNSGQPLGNSNTANQPFGQSTQNQQNQQNQSTAPTGSAPQIDLAHIRSTTKFDHLQEALRKDIEELDNAILNQQKECQDLGEILLPQVKQEGSQLEPGIDYVSTKLDELEQGLGNDAEAIVAFINGELHKDEGEAKCVFRNVDRMKVPRQYQTPGNTIEGVTGNTSVLGNSMMNGTGLSGWWNQPQTHRGARSISGVGGQSVQLVNEDVDDGSSTGPKTMIDLFDTRAEQFKRVNEEQKRLLAEIENFVEGLEEKVIVKEREVNERLNYGNANVAERRAEEKERQMNQLRFVFGEVQRGLYEMADRVGTTKDGIIELVMNR